MPDIVSPMCLLEQQTAKLCTYKHSGNVCTVGCAEIEHGQAERSAQDLNTSGEDKHWEVTCTTCKHESGQDGLWRTACEG